ncbi:acyltransferase family protein [Streptomyces sp. NPDC055105]|uniref:acyltransferase family protein n=1 Tax=Streptomyces sp. NPDC055105 TaxID=3365719 RepID=UPI0037D34A5B
MTRTPYAGNRARTYTAHTTTDPAAQSTGTVEQKPAPGSGRTSPPPGATHSGPAQRPDIQGLRALAVTLVVLGHTGVTRFSGGYVGVDVFFVISGFLITSSLLRELSATDRISIRAFYARRALRLLPASALVVLVTLAGSWLLLSKVRFAEYMSDAFASAVYAVNFRLAATGTDYLAEGSPPSPFQHFWSLAVEEQFYLLWPLLLLLGWRLSRRRRALLAIPLVTLCVVSFGLSVYVTGRSAPWAYFGSHTRAWELGAGALVALALLRPPRLPAGVAVAMTWAGLACVIAAALRFDADTPFPGTAAAVPVIGAALVIVGGTSPAWPGARRMLTARPVTWLGGVSYSWYLWHWPFLVIGPKALDRPAGTHLELALGAAALLPAWLTLRLVENPVRFHRALRGRPGRGLRLGLALSAVTASTALVAAAFPPSISSGEPAPVLKDALASAPDPGARLTQALGTTGIRLPDNLTPPLTGITDVRSAVYRDGCHQNYAGTSTPMCVYGDRSSKHVVVLFGDSHAAQWFPALNVLAVQHHWKLISMTKASCKAATVTTLNAHRPYATCDRWRADALARIEKLRPSLVLVSSSDAGTPATTMRDPLAGWTDGYVRTFRRLAPSGARVVALLDTPWPREDVLDCAAIHPLHLRDCSVRVPEALHDVTRRNATKAAARSTGVAVIDPQPWLCTAHGDCPVAVYDTFVYRDESHMAEGYAEALAPVLGRALGVRSGN